MKHSTLTLSPDSGLAFDIQSTESDWSTDGIFSTGMPNQLMVSAPHITVVPDMTRRRRMKSGTGLPDALALTARARPATNMMEP